MWSIVLVDPQGNVTEMYFKDGDSLVVEFPFVNDAYSGRHAALKWKLKKAEERAAYYKKKLAAPLFSEVDLSNISTDALMREVGSRAALYENH